MLVPSPEMSITLREALTGSLSKASTDTSMAYEIEVFEPCGPARSLSDFLRMTSAMKDASFASVRMAQFNRFSEDPELDHSR